MANSKNYWAGTHKEGWSVRKEGASRTSSVHETQSEAWSEARRRARGAEGEAILKGRDGKIRSRNSYGNDPFPPKG